MKTKSLLRLCSIIFGVVATAHLLRVLFGLTITIAGTDIPLWISLIGTVVAGYLSYNAYKLSK
jgi:hypothetical protein